MVQQCTGECYTGIADEDTYSGGKVTLIRSASWISEWEHTHRYTLKGIKRKKKYEMKKKKK